MKYYLIGCITLFLLSGCGANKEYQWRATEVTELADRAEANVQKAFQTLWEYREEKGIASELRDPKKTGVIGVADSPITTTEGLDTAKHLSTQPGWAKWLVTQLARGNFNPGDKVAVSLTGSFPALNIAVLCALQELKADVTCISSVGSSKWGANETQFTWLDMERVLREKGVLTVGSSAVTLGGTDDIGADWGENGLRLAKEAIRRSGLPFLESKNLDASVRARLTHYGMPADYKLFISVGRGAGTLGGGSGKKKYERGGWIYDPAGRPQDHPGTADFFQESGVNCLVYLHLDQINQKLHILPKPAPVQDDEGEEEE